MVSKGQFLQIATKGYWLIGVVAIALAGFYGPYVVIETLHFHPKWLPVVLFAMGLTYATGIQMIAGLESSGMQETKLGFVLLAPLTLIFSAGATFNVWAIMVTTLIMIPTTLYIDFIWENLPWGATNVHPTPA